MSRLYCLDTSSLIESWWRLYPPDIFPSFWENLEDGISNGHFIAPDIVLAELKRQDDDLHQWAKNNNQLFLPLDADVQLAQADIINKFPQLIMQKKIAH